MDLGFLSVPELSLRAVNIVLESYVFLYLPEFRLHVFFLPFLNLDHVVNLLTLRHKP